MSQEQSREQFKTKLMARFKNRCWYCGISFRGQQVHIDHIIPKSRGGSDKESNLAAVCSFCNYAKATHLLDVYMGWLEWVRSGGSFTPFNMSGEEVSSAIYESKVGSMPELREAVSTEA